MNGDLRLIKFRGGGDNWAQEETVLHELDAELPAARYRIRIVTDSFREEKMIDQTIRMTFDSLWDKGKRTTVTADTDLERVLVDGARIPLLYWRQNFFFMGAKNEGLSTLTRGEFPAKADPAGSHPVFALKPVAGRSGKMALERRCRQGLQVPRGQKHCLD